MKRNAKGNGSIRQRNDGRYEGRIIISGKRKSFYGNKQSDVVRAMRAAKKASDDGTYFEPSKLSISSWLDTWLNEYVTPSVKPLTLAAYKSQCEIHIKPALGRIKLMTLQSTQIQKLYNVMRMKKGLSAKTIRNTHGVLHKALQKAVELRYANTNPSNACTLPRVQKKEIKPLNETEIKAFLHEIDQNEPYKNLFITALFTGMRQGEVCGLSWDDVDFKNGTICVRQQLLKEKKTGGKCYIATPKNDKSRIITPAPFVMFLLRTIENTQKLQKLKAGKAWENEWGLIFTNDIGHFIFPQMAFRRFKAIATKIGRPDARFHDLRHTYAVTSLQEGDDIKTVQTNLGHSTASFTLDVYGHVSEKMKTDSAARMESFIKKMMG